MNIVNGLISYFFRIPSQPSPYLPSSGSPIKILYSFFVSPILAACFAYLILFYLITFIMFGGGYDLWIYLYSVSSIFLLLLLSWNSSVDIAMRYGTAGRDSIPGRGKRFFLFSITSRPVLEPTQPPIQWVAGTLSPEVKAAET
jgi:hypothetical protein